MPLKYADIWFGGKKSIYKSCCFILNKNEFYFRELCTVIVNQFAEENIDLNDKAVFENCIKTLCNSFLQQSLCKNNIEKENIDTALEVSRKNSLSFYLLYNFRLCI